MMPSIQTKFRPPITTLIGQNSGQDIFVVGTGTSLRGFDFSQLEGRITIALNNAVDFFVPTYFLFSDHPLWRRYEKHKIAPQTTVITREDSSRDLSRSGFCCFHNQIYVFNRVTETKECLPKDANLFCSHTVAIPGIMLAWKLGAHRIFMLGIDAYSLPHATYADGARQEPHGRVEHVQGDNACELIIENRHKVWQQEMKDLRESFTWRGVYKDKFPDSGVFNLSPLSTITVWEKVDRAQVGLI